MTDTVKMLEMVNVFKELVDFVSDDKKVKKFYADVGDIQKISADLATTKETYNAAMRTLNIVKEQTAENDRVKADLAKREATIASLERKLEEDRRNTAEDRNTVAELLKETQKAANAATKDNSVAAANRFETTNLLREAEAKVAELDKAIADYKDKLQKLSTL